MQIINSDVLIMGSGAAGLTAAIAARASGLEVLVVGKNAPGRGTATILSGGGFSGGWAGNSPEEHLEQTLKAGRGLNQMDLVTILAQEAPLRFQELIDWGLPVRSRPGFLNAAGKAPVYGRPLIDCMLARARDKGVQFRDNLVLRALAAEHDMVLVLAYDSGQGSWLGLAARSLVLAGGGASALFKRHDNPQRITGDPYAIGFAGGAILQDMEFAQFYPLGLAETGLPSAQASLIPPALADRGKLLNDRGEHILEKYDIRERPAALRARDRLSQALFSEKEWEGQDVWLDVSMLSKEQWCSDPLSAATWDHLGTRCQMRKRPVRVAPMAHFFVGGLSIKPDGATSLPGVFAAGEAAGGVHGANRMGGNALTETIVFGPRAGHSAAAWARKRPFPATASLSQRMEAMIPASAPGKPRAGATELKGELKSIMWQYGGIRRSLANLEKGLDLMAEISREAAKTDEANDAKEFRQ